MLPFWNCIIRCAVAEILEWLSIWAKIYGKAKEGNEMKNWEKIEYGERMKKGQKQFWEPTTGLNRIINLLWHYGKTVHARIVKTKLFLSDFQRCY